ncbi:RHS repeat-associated core domain-containing protein [Stenotrophomonas sp. PUT21]|uniref:RHS repeat-associated core domain-containing protein n=1 Tax=Stenotrophomonas sp. PUT21 TaxID=3456954 RepID=UPI003FCE0A3F
MQGNLSTKNGQGYQFDFGNRLRVATSLERYRYDGHGRRSSVIDAGSGKNRHYLYSQGGALAYLWDQGTGERTQYIQLAGSLVAARKVAGSGGVRYQHTDALGSPVAETNEQAAVVLRTAYTPYGASIGAAQDGVGYTGHVMDGSTGLTYMQQRYMDPTVGMFLSVDPVTAYSNPIAAFNRYLYANNNPYRFNDPDGRWGKLIVEVIRRIVPKIIPRAAPKGGPKAAPRSQPNSQPRPEPKQSTSKQDQNSSSSEQSRRLPDRDLPRDRHGNPKPDADANGPHTQLGQKDGRNGRYDQAREFDGDGKPVRDIDFTDHGRPGTQPNPHQHRYQPNSTGGTPSRGPTQPIDGS